MCQDKTLIRKQGEENRNPPPRKESSQKVIELFADEPSFSGILDGIESGRCLYCNSVMRKKKLKNNLKKQNMAVETVVVFDVYFALFRMK